MISVLSLLLSLVLLTPQDPLTSSNLYLRKTDGEVISGKLMSLEGDEVKLKVSVLGGSMVVTKKLSDFEPASAFRIQLAANPPKTFEQHFDMAKKAGDAGVLRQAGKEAREALKTVEGKPDFKEKEQEVRAWGADTLEKRVKDMVAKGDLKEAKHALELLTTRLPDQRTEEQLDAIADQVDALAASEKAEKDAARAAKMDAKVQADIDRRLKPIVADIDKGNAAYADAVRKSNKTVASTNLCEKAINFYKKAYKSLETLVKKHPDDQHLANVSADLGKEMHDNAIQAALHAANMLTVQSDFKGAMSWAQKVLAYEPDNAEAKQMVQTITLASAAASGNWGWGWTTAGPPVGFGAPPRRNR